MDIGQLRAFLAVAEELHFGRAAERLHIAQPPLSRTIRQLERELGTSLFDRSTRRVRLTPSGQALIGPALEAAEAMRRAEAAARSADRDGEAGLVRIAFAGVSTHRLVASLARGDTDIALGRWDIIPAEVSAQVVMEDSLVIALPGSHPLAGCGRLSAGQLAAESFVSLPLHEGAVLPDRLRALSRASGFVADIAQVAPDTQTALALVSAEVGAHLTLASVARNVTDPHVVFVPLDDPAPDVGLKMAWRRADTSPALRAVLDELKGLEAIEDG